MRKIIREGGAVDDEERWQSLVASNDAGVKGIVSVIKNALPRELGKLKKNINREIDNGTYTNDVTPEFVDWLIKQRKLEQGPAVADTSHIDRQSHAANAASRKTKRMFLGIMFERKRRCPIGTIHPR